MRSPGCAGLLLRKAEKALRVVCTEEVMVEGNGIHRPCVHEQDGDFPGVDHRVPGKVLHPGTDPGMLLDEQPVTEQATLIEQVVDKIPREIHEFMDGRLNRWSRYSSMVLPGTDSLAEPAGVSSLCLPARAKLSRVRTDWGIQSGCAVVPLVGRSQRTQG